MQALEPKGQRAIEEGIQQVHIHGKWVLVPDPEKCIQPA